MFRGQPGSRSVLAIPTFTPQVMAARFRQALGTVIVTAWCPARIQSPCFCQ
jgi:hypothetical protein